MKPMKTKKDEQEDDDEKGINDEAEKCERIKVSWKSFNNVGTSFSLFIVVLVGYFVCVCVLFVSPWSCAYFFFMLWAVFAVYYAFDYGNLEWHSTNSSECDVFGNIILGRYLYGAQKMQKLFCSAHSSAVVVAAHTWCLFLSIFLVSLHESRNFNRNQTKLIHM